MGRSTHRQRGRCRGCSRAPTNGCWTWPLPRCTKDILAAVATDQSRASAGVRWRLHRPQIGGLDRKHRHDPHMDTRGRSGGRHRRPDRQGDPPRLSMDRRLPGNQGRHPRTARQIMGGRAWRASTAAQVARRAFGTDHILGVPLPPGSGTVKGYLIYRSASDFTYTDIAHALRLQPLLDGIERQYELLTRWRQTTTRPGQPDPDQRAVAFRLTPREISVLELLSRSLTADAIGRRLGIATRTVHRHIENIYRRMGTRDRLATVLRAQACGLLPPPAP